MKITVDVDEELYRALKVEAARSDRSVRDAIAEAIERWLERQEDEEDLRSAEAALAEYRRVGGISAAEFFRQLAREAEAAYGDSETRPAE